MIEDAAQAHGANYKGRRVGSFWRKLDVSAFIQARILELQVRAAQSQRTMKRFTRNYENLRNWGSDDRYHHEFLAFNFRLENIQAAILRIKLRHLNDWNAGAHPNSGRSMILLSECECSFA